MPRLFEMRVTLAKLRCDHPSWHWSPYRQGMGWAYTGHKESPVPQKCDIYAVSVMCDEDDFITQWRVEEVGKPYSVSYYMWDG